MSAPRLVVVEHDGWVLRLLAEGLRSSGFVVATESSADAALARVRELVPDAVLADVGLPGKNGYSLVSELRAEPCPISIVPVALLAEEDDEDARLAAFSSGADALLTRPFKIDEVAAQMTALVQLARRMRERRTSLIDSLAAGPPSTTFKGDLAHMPAPSLLMLLEIERKTGVVDVVSNGRRAQLSLVNGTLVSAEVEGKTDAVDVLREILSWEEGRIVFHARDVDSEGTTPRPVRVLLARAGYAAIPILQGPASSPSVPRMNALRPPPGARVAADSTPLHPALANVDTRKVDVPSMRPPSMSRPAEDEPKPSEAPPTTRRPA
jgi:CheY-like chemotaxis protein